jgi:uncharacterized membrane protein
VNIISITMFAIGGALIALGIDLMCKLFRERKRNASRPSWQSQAAALTIACLVAIAAWRTK